MAFTTLASSTQWTSGTPKITLSFYYEKQRSTTNTNDMQYRIKIEIDPLYNTAAYFGFTIYCDITLGGTKVVSQRGLKAAATKYWSTTQTYTSSWFTVSDVTDDETVPLAIRIYGGQTNTRNVTYNYSLPADTGYGEDVEEEDAPVIWEGHLFAVPFVAQRGKWVMTNIHTGTGDAVIRTKGIIKGINKE